MIESYFTDFYGRLQKKSGTTKASSKKSTSKTASKKKSSSKSVSGTKLDPRKTLEALSKIIPSELTLGTHPIIDSTGYSPEGADAVIYKEYCQDIVPLMGGYIPYELIYAFVHLETNLTRKSLGTLLTRVATVKGINAYNPETEDPYIIPSLIIIDKCDYPFQELKNDIINYYNVTGTQASREMEIMAIADKGLVVKNWREPRGFVALETGRDTFKWFFILMSEFFSVERKVDLDFRNYVGEEPHYPEY